MAAITASLVKDLRDKTGAGMMDCKAALAETGGDVEAATDWLRKKGLAAAAKKAGRVAAEGLVGVATEAGRGALVEVNSETDFVARNELFQDFVAKAARVALAAGGDFSAVAAARLDDGKSVQDSLTDLVARIGENLTLRRAAALSVGNGVIGSYVHNAATSGMGRIGVLVALESDGDTAKLAEIARQLAMHVAAASPQWLAIDDIEPEALARERAVLMEQARASGRPDNIIEKMVEGRLRKFYEETVLSEQLYVIDGERRVGAVVADAAKQAGAPVRLAGFVRFALGEGIERKQSDLASEVAATLGG